MFKLHPKSLLIAILLFVIEVLIALYVKDSFIRPFVGDLLVVMLIYYFLKAFIQVSPHLLAMAVLLFSFLIEILQYFNFVDLIGLQDFKIARIVLGTSLDWLDLVAYTVGVFFILIMEKAIPIKAAKSTS